MYSIAVVFLVPKGLKNINLSKLYIFSFMQSCNTSIAVSIRQVVPVQYSDNFGKVSKGLERVFVITDFLIEVSLWLQLFVMCCYRFHFSV